MKNLINMYGMSITIQARLDGRTIEDKRVGVYYIDVNCIKKI